MADAQIGESRQFNLHSAGTDLVEGSALAVKGASGAITVDGFTETGSSALVALAVGGGTPNDSVDSGNPIKIGGYASTAVPTSVSADGDRVNLWASRFGAQNVILRDTAGAAYPTTAGLPVRLYDATGSNISPNIDTTAADAQTTSSGLQVRGYNFGFNGTTWDRLRTEAGTTGFLGVGGSVAHDSVDAGNPVKFGGYAKTLAPTSVADGDRANAWFQPSGALVTTIVYNGGPGDALTNSNAGMVAAMGNNVTPIVTLANFNGTSWDRLRSIASLDAAPNVDTGITAVGAGPGYDRKQNPAGVSATSTASAVTIEVDGADTIAVVFTTIGVTPGSMIIEASGDDGTNWITARMVLATATEKYVDGAFVPAVGDSFMVRTTGIRRIRVRVNAVYASGTVTVKWTASLGVALIKAMDLAPQPHNIGQTILNYQSGAIGVVTSQVAVAATAAKRVYVAHVRIAVGGTTSGSIAIYSGTGAFTDGTSQTLFYSPFIPSATTAPGVIIQFVIPWASATVNEDIRITTTGLTATHVEIQYYVA